jgi:hypothetical protein
MNSPSLPPLIDPSGQTAMPSARAQAADVDALLSDTTTVDASRGTPPQELLEQMSAAAKRLRASRRRLRFSADAPGRRTRIELLDSRGKKIRDLSVSEAIDLAAGKSSL